MERIPEAEAKGFRVIVDYAFEPVAMAAAYDTVRLLNPARLIHVLGAAGGGRDRAKRPVLGALAAKLADMCIVTNEDPYDDDPMEIIRAVARGAEDTGKKPGETLFIEADRRAAIARALHMAAAGDVVLITGKGSEQGMAVRGRIVPWDDRAVVREEISRL
jgi:UDP-N-acetylmuramoyl-L-alanyl-D-glutamate--2,6-diaminopimelate ligase